MRTIKFRGKSAITGEIIYGIGVKKSPDCTMMILDCLVGEEVEPDSVAQFIGYDKNGKEFYSDDKVIDEDGVEVDFEILLFEYREIGSKLIGLELKEE